MKKSKKKANEIKKRKRLVTIATIGEAIYMGYAKGGLLEALFDGATALSKVL